MADTGSMVNSRDRIKPQLNIRFLMVFLLTMGRIYSICFSGQQQMPTSSATGRVR